MILFYHKDSVVAYTVMERSVADFTSFDVSKKYSIRQQLFLNKERKVIVAHWSLQIIVLALPTLKTSAKSVQTTRVVCTNYGWSLYRLQLKSPESTTYLQI